MMVWYSPNVFGKKWMKLAGISARKAKEAKDIFSKLKDINRKRKKR